MIVIDVTDSLTSAVLPWRPKPTLIDHAMPHSDPGREVAEVGAALPSWSDEDLARLDADALTDLLITDEDRAPRNVIDAAARLGDAMVSALRNRLAGPWNDTDPLGPWWLRLHAVMVLGLVAQENAGLLLLEFMRRMDVAKDINLQDWLASEWPALFLNKPASVLPRLRDLCADRGLDWYIRAGGLDAMLAMAEREGPAELDASLAWVARMAADEQEDWDMRLCCGSVLLDFPREIHRSLVDDLAARQTGWTAHFDANDITRAYAGIDDPAWRRHDNPWDFYTPESIRKRLERWATEDAEDDGDDDTVRDDADDVLPYVRDVPKVGRNDPCPCGSGKKYKKCCLPKLEG